MHGDPRGDRDIAARRGKALCREGRRVVAVDQIVGDSRVVGVAGKLPLQHRRGLQRDRIGVIGQRLRRGQIECGEDLRFVVGRIAGGQSRECLGAGLLARGFRACLPRLVVRGDGVEVIALALGRCHDPVALCKHRV